MPATRHADGVFEASGDILLTLDDYRALRSIQRMTAPPSKNANLGRFIDSNVLGRRASSSWTGASAGPNALDVLHALMQDYFLPSISGLEDDTLRSNLKAAVESDLELGGNVDYALRIDGGVVDLCIYETNYFDMFPKLRNLSPTFRVRHGESLSETDDPHAYIAAVEAAVGELLDARFPGQVVATDGKLVGVELNRAALISIPAVSDAPLFEVAGELFRELEATLDNEGDFPAWEDDAHTAIEYVSGGEVLGDGEPNGFRGIRLYTACSRAIRF